MAKRYVGDATIRMEFRQAQVGGDYYKCSVSMKGQHLASLTVRPPPAGYGDGVAYDAPAAYDQVAVAVLAFAGDDTREETSADIAGDIRNLTGWAIDERGAYIVRRAQ